MKTIITVFIKRYKYLFVILAIYAYITSGDIVGTETYTDPITFNEEETLKTDYKNITFKKYLFNYMNVLFVVFLSYYLVSSFKKESNK